MWDLFGFFAFLYLLIDLCCAVIRGIVWLITLPFRIF